MSELGGTGGVIEYPPAARTGGEDAAGGQRRTVKPVPGWVARLPWVYLVLLVVTVGALAYYPEVANPYRISLTITVLLTAT